MRIVFAGTPEFAIPTLEALVHSEHKVIGVYTQPDRPAGRGQKLTPSPVKQLAIRHQIPIYQPVSLKDPFEQQQLKLLDPQVIVVVAYGLILAPAVLEIPEFGCINVHASLLPRWRGAAPIQRAILAGDRETGITIMQMEKGLDTGPMLKKIFCPIENSDTSLSLQTKLAHLGGAALLETLRNLKAYLVHAEIQNNADASYAHKVTKTEAQIIWSSSAMEIERQVRAFIPRPVSYSFLEQQMIRIWETQAIYEDSSQQSGTILATNKKGILVATGNGLLQIKKAQLPGGRCLPVEEILHAKPEIFAPGKKFTFLNS